MVVLDKGKVVEHDNPFLLLVKKPTDLAITNPDGVFASMVLETGDESARSLFMAAKHAYEKKFGR